MQGSKWFDMVKSAKNIDDVKSSKRNLDDTSMLLMREVSPYLLPSVYRKVIDVIGYKKENEKYTTKDLVNMGRKLIAPKRSMDYGSFDSRGGTQMTVEYLLNNKKGKQNGNR